MKECNIEKLLGKACLENASISMALAGKDASEFLRKAFGTPQISLVSGPPEGIKSQWQAGFLQVFPMNYTELPYHHKTDAAFFRKYWLGEPRDMSFEHFIEWSRHNNGMEKTKKDAEQN